MSYRKLVIQKRTEIIHI